MVTTRSQAKRATTASPVKEQKKSKFFILDTPTYTYKVGSTNVKVYELDYNAASATDPKLIDANFNQKYSCAGELIHAYDTFIAEKREQEQGTDPKLIDANFNLKKISEKKEQVQVQKNSVRSPIMTRSKSKKCEHENKVNTWKNVANTTIENIRNATSRSERREFWTYTITSLLRDLENQNGENCVEYKTIIATEVFKILSYMYNKHFMDFKSYEAFWRLTESKEKELLNDLEKHKKNRKINDETYFQAKKVIQEAQTFQIMFDNLVFPK